MTSQVIFKIDKKLKDQAMHKAQKEGMAFAYILKRMPQAYVQGELEMELVSRPKLNAKTLRELKQISKDIKENKNLVGPFNSAEEMIKSLRS